MIFILDLMKNIKVAEFPNKSQNTHRVYDYYLHFIE